MLPKLPVTACLLPFQTEKCVAYLVNFQLRLRCQVSVTFEVSVQFKDQSSHHLFICCSCVFFSGKQNFFCKSNLQVFICVFKIKFSLRPYFWHTSGYPHVDYKELFLFTALSTDWWVIVGIFTPFRSTRTSGDVGWHGWSAHGTLVKATFCNFGHFPLGNKCT